MTQLTSFLNRSLFGFTDFIRPHVWTTITKVALVICVMCSIVAPLITESCPNNSLALTGCHIAHANRSTLYAASGKKNNSRSISMPNHGQKYVNVEQKYKFVGLFRITKGGACQTQMHVWTQFPVYLARERNKQWKSGSVNAELWLAWRRCGCYLKRCIKFGIKVRK